MHAKDWIHVKMKVSSCAKFLGRPLELKKKEDDDDEQISSLTNLSMLL